MFVCQRRLILGMGVALLIGSVLGVASAQTGDGGPAALAIDPAAVAATVGEKEIYGRDVLKLVAASTKGRQLPPKMQALVQAQVLEQLINNYLVREFVKQSEFAPPSIEVSVEIERLRRKLASQNKSLKELLKQRSVSEEQLREDKAWELGWQSLLKRYLTDERLEAYFNEHRREFDGSEVAASHILLRPEGSSDGKSLAELIQKAGRIREEITSGKISFAEAAWKYSDGPSRKEGGDLGFFPRHGLMEEDFSRTAFALKVGEISQPVRTRFGVHLIQVTEQKPGDKKWTDVREQLAGPVSQLLFAQLAERERQRVGVEYTGSLPYLKPGTTSVVVPQPKPTD